MKYSLDAIRVEVLALAFIEFVFVSTLVPQWFGTCLATSDPLAFVRKGSVDNSLIPSLLQWFAHHPLGAATMVYAGGILGVLL